MKMVEQNHTRSWFI